MKKRHKYYEKTEGNKSSDDLDGTKYKVKNAPKENKKELKDFKINTNKYHKRSMKIKITEYDIKDR